LGSVAVVSPSRAWIERAKRSLLPSGGTTERAVRSGIRAVATNGLVRALQFGRLLVLAALLAPVDLGLMRIATLTVAALVLFGAAVYGISILANGEMRRRLLAVSPL
jgi:hypothetical protein